MRGSCAILKKLVRWGLYGGAITFAHPLGCFHQVSNGVRFQHDNGNRLPVHLGHKYFQAMNHIGFIGECLTRYNHSAFAGSFMENLDLQTGWSSSQYS